jgi:hypothetical protein
MAEELVVDAAAHALYSPAVVAHVGALKEQLKGLE